MKRVDGASLDRDMMFFPNGTSRKVYISAELECPSTNMNTVEYISPSKRSSKDNDWMFSPTVSIF